MLNVLLRLPLRWLKDYSKINHPNFFSEFFCKYKIYNKIGNMLIIKLLKVFANEENQFDIVRNYFDKYSGDFSWKY